MAKEPSKTLDGVCNDFVFTDVMMNTKLSKIFVIAYGNVHDNEHDSAGVLSNAKGSCGRLVRCSVLLQEY